MASYKEITQSTWADNTYNGMTARSIGTNLEVYEAARNSFFVLEIDNLDNLLHPNYTGSITDENAKFLNGEKAKEYLRLNVTKCPVPTYSVEVLKYQRGNDVVKFAGVPTFGEGSLTVDDVVGLDTKSILMAWLRNAYDPHTFKGGRMKNYKKNCTLIEYTQDYQAIRTWTLYGCFIYGLSEGEFDKESDGKRQITANFVYDYAIMETNIENESNL